MMPVRVVEIIPARLVEIAPVAVVELVPVLVVEIIPVLVVEMIPPLARAGADMARINIVDHTMDLRFFIGVLLWT
jgi:hypothetical protein